MKTYKLEENIKVFCIKASSFPDGIQKAHQKLHEIVPFSERRKYYGISHPVETGEIEYKSAVSEIYDGELSSHSLEKFTIPKGNYLYKDVNDFVKNITQIGAAFKKLIADPQIDPKSFCLEWYFNETDCRCMVKTNP